MIKLAALAVIAFTHVTVIDTAGGPPRADMTVVVRDGRIATVEQSGAAPKGAQVVDGRGKFLIPGLWDMHVHLSWTTASALPVLIANGVTSVRDLGSNLGQLDDWRTKIAAGLITGPRIVRAGPILNGQKFNQYQLVTGTPEETRGVARALKQVDVDFLKIHRRMPRESYFALIDEAKKLGLPVVGHIPMTVTPEEASDAGQAMIEHVETLFEGTFSAGLKDIELVDALKRFRGAQAEALFARFAKNKTVVDPTIVAYDAIPRADDPGMKYVAASVRKIPSFSPEELVQWKAKVAEYKLIVGQMHRAGIMLLAGSDIAGPRIPGFTLHDELALLVESGLTPLEALQTATINPAKVLGRTADLGTIEPGKLADLVLLSANPLADIHNTQRIAAVVANGKLLGRAELDALLREGEEMAKKN
ncbi:MAG: amidohydrolase family protein [Acidobacteriota bacterium]